MMNREWCWRRDLVRVERLGSAVVFGDGEDGWVLFEARVDRFPKSSLTPQTGSHVRARLQWWAIVKQAALWTTQIGRQMPYEN